MELRFSHLPLPCPLNSLYGVMAVRKGRRMIHMKVLTKRARVRRDLVVAEIIKQCRGAAPMMSGPVQVVYTITPRDRRTPDIDAYCKQLFDCLVHARVIADDGQIVQQSGERMPTPRNPGWIDVTIIEVPK